MSIIIDTRGTNELKLVQLLREKHLPVEHKRLESADVVVHNDKYTIGIERKTISDAVFSVIGSKNSYEKSNRHLWTQLEVLKATYPKYVVILEGAIDLGDPYYKTFMGIYLSILFTWQIPVLLTANLEDTAQKLAQIYTSYGNYKVSKALPPAVHKAKSTKDIKISMLCTVDGIGIQTAKKLYDIEPLLLGTPLGEEYVEKILEENLSKKPRERLRKVLYNVE